MRRASRRSYRISPHSHSHTVQNVLDTSTIQTPGIDGRAWSHTHILVQYTRSSLLVSSLSSEARTGRTGLLSSGVMSEGGVSDERLVPSPLSIYQTISSVDSSHGVRYTITGLRSIQYGAPRGWSGGAPQGRARIPLGSCSYGGREPKDARLPRSDARRTHRRHRRRPTPHPRGDRSIGPGRSTHRAARAEERLVEEEAGENLSAPRGRRLQRRGGSFCPLLRG